MGWEETKEASDPSDRSLTVLLMASADKLLPAAVLTFSVSASLSSVMVPGNIYLNYGS